MDLGFGDFRYRDASGSLEKGGVEIPLTPKTRELLLLLVRNPGKTFSREEISTALWPEVVVTDNALSFQVAELRKALGDPSLIRTVQRVGYRWDGPAVVQVPESGHAPAPAAPPERTAPRGRTGSALRVAAACAGLVLLASSLVAIRSFRKVRGEPAPSEGQPVHLAVMPFAVIGDAHEDVGAGLSDSLAIRLSLLPGLAVRSTSSVQAARAAEPSSLGVARALGTDVVVDGTVRAESGGVDVRVRLLDARSGRALFAEDAHFAEGDRLDVEERLAGVLARQLGLPLERLAIERWSTPGTSDVAELYWRAQALSLRGWRATHEALQLLEKALAADPGFAAAHALRAQLLGLEVGYGTAADPAANHRLALAEAREAVRLEPSNSYARAILGGAIADMGDLDTGAAEIFRAREEAPSRPAVHMVIGWLYRWAGLLDRAAASYETALRLDPSLWRAGVHLAYVRTLQGDEEGARATLERLAGFGATAETAALEMSAWRAYQHGDLAGTESACRAVTGREPVLNYCERLDALVAARRRDRGPARALLARPGEDRYPDGRRRFDRAALLAAVGQDEDVFRDLAEAERLGFQTPEALVRDPDLARLASDARFRVLRERWESRRGERARSWR